MAELYKLWACREYPEDGCTLAKNQKDAAKELECLGEDGKYCKGCKGPLILPLSEKNEKDGLLIELTNMLRDAEVERDRYKAALERISKRAITVWDSVNIARGALGMEE